MKVRSRLAVQGVACLLSAVVCFASILEPQWFELLFDESPDAGSGAFETWVAVIVSAAACLTFARMSWRTWTQVREHKTPGSPTRC